MGRTKRFVRKVLENGRNPDPLTNDTHETKPESRKQNALRSFLPVPVRLANFVFFLFCFVAKKRKRVLGKEEKGKFSPLAKKGVFLPFWEEGAFAP